MVAYPPQKVDFDYVVKFARLAKEQNIDNFHLVSSAGANSKSWFLYMKTKGEVSVNPSTFIKTKQLF